MIKSREEYVDSQIKYALAGGVVSSALPATTGMSLANMFAPNNSSAIIGGGITGAFLGGAILATLMAHYYKKCE